MVLITSEFTTSYLCDEENIMRQFARLTINQLIYVCEVPNPHLTRVGITAHFKNLSVELCRFLTMVLLVNPRTTKKLIA